MMHAAELLINKGSNSNIQRAAQVAAWQQLLQRCVTCAGVNVMCSAPPTVLAMLAIVEMSPEHRNATADTAAIWPSKLSQPTGKQHSSIR